MTIDSMETLFYEELKDIYDAEKQLTKALPKVVKAAQSLELKEALQEHLEVTENQVSRLEQVFGTIGQSPKSKTCEGMKGLIKEGKSTLEQDASEPFFDAAIIGAAQKVEHYEIAVYGTLREIALKLGNKEAAELLQKSLDEEKQADERLSNVAMQLLDGYSQEGNGRKQPKSMRDADRTIPIRRTRKVS